MSSRFCAFVGAAAFSAAVAAAGPVPDAPLQLSRDLTPPAPDTAAAENGRALLRLKLRATQSGIDGTAAVQELIGRLERMDHAVADLQEAVLTTPAVAPLPPAAPAGPAAGLAWLPAGAAGAAALFLGFWLGRRDRRRDDAEPRIAPATATITQPMSRSNGLPPALAPAADEPLPEPEAAQAEAVAADGELSLELADVMLSMGLSLGAAQALENHIRAHPRETLYHWLKLLDIYRQAGAHAEFDRAVMDLHRQFNVAPPPWQPGAAATPAPGLENYPHISARIRELWRTRACAEYLNRLLEDNRGGTRNGFPQAVAEELLFLQAILRG